MIFLDNASTTKPDDEILQNFIENQKFYFNPGALYKKSLEISENIEKTRQNIISLLNGEINSSFLFTSSSTEANNIILNSLISNNKNEEYIFSSLEHPSVYNIAINLLNQNRIVHFVNTKDGKIDINHLLTLINKNTKFCSLIHVSNETGEINDINNIARLIKEINPKTFIHCDGVQALGKIKVNLENIDFYTISSHKIYGLKGIAGFYAKNLKTLKPFVIGGGQEFNIRSGTTNAPMIFTFEKTIENAVKGQENHFNHTKKLNLHLRELLSNIDEIKINSSINASPNILSVSILGLNAETILNLLSTKDICVGIGSACSSRKSGNRILESMNKTKEEILGNLRISFSKNTKLEEVDEFYNNLREIITNLRIKLK